MFRVYSDIDWHGCMSGLHDLRFFRADTQGELTGFVAVSQLCLKAEFHLRRIGPRHRQNLDLLNDLEPFKGCLLQCMQLLPS